MATYPIYQIYVELKDYTPPMWRRFQVIGDLTIAKLGYIIMGLYEARNYYSYEFRVDEFENFKRKHPEYVANPELLKNINKKFSKRRFGITRKNNAYTYIKKDGYGELEDACKEKLMNIITAPNEELIFKYDPEINWTFRIVVEKIFTDKKVFAKEFPKLLGGSGFGIIEVLNRGI